jgi:alpha-beta hydrolase superfamily lysophospholipase
LALSVRWVSALKKWVRMIEACESSDLGINIVQGDQDGTVEWRYNMPLLLEKFPQRKLLMIEGGRHHVVNEEATKRKQAYQWLQQVIAN